MNERFFVLVEVKVPGGFGARATPEQKRRSAAQFVRGLLRRGLAESDVTATLGGAIGLTPDHVSRLIRALRRAPEGDDAHPGPSELRALIEHLVADLQEEEAP